MNKKSKNVSLEDISKKEISIVEANDKIAKLEKEKLRDKKIIAEYKEREKATARALILYERKIKYIKETSIDALLSLSKIISEGKDNFADTCTKLSSDYVKSTMLEYKDAFVLYENRVYDICNALEKNAVITNEERAFISNKKKEKKEEPMDIQSRFDRLKQEFNQKIGSSVTRKRGRPKKGEQSILADIGLRNKVEKQVDEQETTKTKLNEIFYEAPVAKKSAASQAIPQTEDSLFDFEEALNPNLSLKDIMADLLTEKQEETIVYDENTRKLEESKRQSDIQMIESGFIINPILQNKPIQNKEIQNKTINLNGKKPTFEKRFLAIQNICKDTK